MRGCYSLEKCDCSSWILFPAYAGVFPISNRCAPFPFPAYAGVFQAEASEKTVVAFPAYAGVFPSHRVLCSPQSSFSRVCGGVTNVALCIQCAHNFPRVCGGVLVRRHPPLVKVDFLCYNTIIINPNEGTFLCLHFHHLE